ncbi:LysR family transcriptional regulator [Lichenihabitans psoromatis]|uniref:LysR family transcriptional regulator n=1 Tax=Lichenihabitans psoromatis TaxID=2528642 RepID=UPI001035A56D|nr:LysR family transcriptional regulator [Lichenihabitans psoromatis]
MRGSEYAELTAFLAVAQERSFRRAALRLGLSPSALSHTIRGLEERLGAKLLHRTTRSVAPTEAGQDLHDRLAPSFADTAGAVAGVRAAGGQPSGTVRLNLPKLAAELVLAGAFGRFAQAYPDVRLEVMVDDGLTDIVAAGFDAGIRPGERVHRDMVAVRVTPDLRAAVVGAPDYLASHPLPRTPHDLKDHACINYRFDASGAVYRWPFAKSGEVLDVTVEGTLTLNDTDLIRRAALDGVGLAYTPEDSVADDLAAGRLVRVLEDWCQPFPGFFLYYPGRRQVPPALRALIDVLRVAGA